MMGKRRRHFVLLSALAGAFGIALFLGAAERGAADTVSDCAGKPLCASIADQLQASRSPSDSDARYMADTVTIFNGGTTSKLVNVTVTITWVDEPKPPAVSVPATSAYRPAFSDERCTETASQTLTCTAPKSLGPDDELVYELVFRTATDENAGGTTVSVRATAKEQDKPTKGGAPPNDAAVTVPNTTPYEGNLDLDVSIGGGNISTTLATAQVGGGTQFSKLPIPASAPRGLYDVLEQNYGGTVACPAPTGFTCFGQHVTTTAVGISPVNLQITYEGPLPAGANEGRIAVVHDRNNGTRVTITAACSSATPTLAEITSSNGCRLVDITRLSGGIARVEISAWDISNGSWGGIG
jgi:hypothetical protein